MTSKQLQAWRHEVVMCMAAEREFKVDELQPWHLRIWLNERRTVDYFPKTGKASYTGTNQYFKIPDIESWLNKSLK